jgi:hypothetical protein
MAVDDDYADLVASTKSRGPARWTPTPDVEAIIDLVVRDRIRHEDTGGQEGRILSSMQLADWLRKRKGCQVAHSTIDRWVASKYGRRSLSQP